jgi:Phosphoesterase family
MRRRARLSAVIAAGLALIMPGVAVAATDTSSVGAPKLAEPGVNLLLNPSAEIGSCTTSGYDAMTIPGWTVITGSPDSVCYGAVDFPRVGSPGPEDAGRALFAGGASGNAIMTQQVSLKSAAALINTDEVEFAFSGWLGGFAGQNDRVRLDLEFDDREGQVLANVDLGPVTNTDRHSVTELTLQRQTGMIPPGATTASVTMSFQWTAGDTTDGYADDVTFAITAPATAARLTVPAGKVVPSFDHVFFVFMENENYGSAEAPANHDNYIVSNPSAPYLNGVIAYNGALLSQMFATTHPSDPNYLAVTGGSTFGWTRDPTVGTDMVSGTNLADELEAAGRTWKGYAEGMSYNCDTTSHNSSAGGYYLPDDEPFMLYADVVGNPSRCAQHNQPLDQLARDLTSARTTPNFVWFAANDVNDMEDGGVKVGDTWLARTLPEILQSPAWTTQRSLLIVSWDEGHTKDFGPGYPNHIPTYVLGSQGTVKDDYVSKLRYTDYSLGATIEDALGVGPMTSNDRYASPLSDIWTTTGASGGMPPGGEA